LVRGSAGLLPTKNTVLWHSFVSLTAKDTVLCYSFVPLTLKDTVLCNSSVPLTSKDTVLCYSSVPLTLKDTVLWNSFVSLFRKIHSRKSSNVNDKNTQAQWLESLRVCFLFSKLTVV